MKIKTTDARTRAKRVKLVVFDVDGVLTDGRIIIDDKGIESKFFNVRDGHGIKLLHRAGLIVAIVTGRTSDVVTHRAKELGITHIYQGSLKKADTMDDLIKETGLSSEEIAFVGDDLIDIPVMRRVGLACAVSDSSPETISFAHIVTERNGGRGAAREVCEFILKAQGLWEEVTKSYFE